jgi:hypothetical protein
MILTLIKKRLLNKEWWKIVFAEIGVDIFLILLAIILKYFYMILFIF